MNANSSDAALKKELRERALSAGFFDMRVSIAALPEPNSERLTSWLAAGMHGEMEYMTRQPRDAQSVLPGCESVLVFAASYYTGNGGAHETPASTCRIAKYALGEDYHYVFRGKLAQFVQWLSKERPGHEWRICVDSAPIPERGHAIESGIGFLAKNTMVIAQGKGSFFLLAEILTTARIEPDAAVAGTCGNCTRCIDACPTGAIVAPFQLDARRCISYLTIEKKSELSTEEAGMLGNWAFGCDVCQDVCPYNKEPLSVEMEELRAGKTINAHEPLATLLAAKSNSEFERQFDRSPLLRPGRRRLQRNAMLSAKQTNQTADTADERR